MQIRNGDHQSGLKPCVYRSSSNKEDSYDCTNLIDLIHDGTVPSALCRICPYARESLPHEFNTGSPGQIDSSAAEPQQDRKPCSGCSEVKRRSPHDATHKDIGDHLARILKRESGDQDECEHCDEEIASLNVMTDKQVLEQIDEIAKAIVHRGRTQARKMLHRMACSLAPEIVTDRVRGWIKEAVSAAERPALQFVWCYWHAGANGDEIRWSVRSVEKFFQGKARITIVGDRPPWFTGHVVRKKQIKLTANHGFRDMLSKMHRICLSDEVNEHFVWMMDDIYFVREFSFQDLETPRAERWSGSKKNAWLRVNCHTMAALAAVGRPNHDYATHMPHTVEKKKLRQLIGEFNLTRETMLWEVLYGNTFRRSPIRSRPFFCRIRNALKFEQYQHVIGNATVINHVAAAWCPGIRRYLMDLLPDPSPTEGGQPVSGKFKLIANPVRVVKRRPKHTHRAVIEQQRLQGAQ